MIMSIEDERWKTKSVRNVIIPGLLEQRTHRNARSANLGSGTSETIARDAQQRAFF